MTDGIEAFSISALQQRLKEVSQNPRRYSGHELRELLLAAHGCIEGFRNPEELAKFVVRAARAVSEAGEKRSREDHERRMA